jgi:hypothetical protein
MNNIIAVVNFGNIFGIDEASPASSSSQPNQAIKDCVFYEDIHQQQQQKNAINFIMYTF